jgi:uncharacterized protein YcfJ
MSSSKRRCALGAALAALAAVPAWAAEDLRSLEVQGQRGQSLEQTRRDRYECHNWAVAQTGETPLAAPPDAEPTDAARDRRAERIDRAIIGAVIGAGIGSLFGTGRHHDDADRVLAGAAAGAAIGAATAGGGEREAAAEPEQPSDYLSALTACLEGRGYSVHLPTTPELTASR